jgi:hypothetical protein
MAEPKKLRDVGTSVRARLLTLARQKGQAFDLLLTRYANERLLHRLSLSPHRSRFVLVSGCVGRRKYGGVLHSRRQMARAPKGPAISEWVSS